MKDLRIALVYDRVNKWGGAEQVLLALHKLFPDAKLFTSVFNKETANWSSSFSIQTSFLQDFPYAKKIHEAYALFMPVAFESFSFDEYDVVISITSEAAKGIITKPSTLHICICLTPTRYLWSGHDEYFKSPLFKTLTSPLISYLRVWDKISSTRPDYFIAISKNIQDRIQKYYNRASYVIYPPALLSIFGFQASSQVFNNGYFLVVSRLVRYKRIDIAIQAANKLGFPLKIIGVGSDDARLKSIAKKNVTFLGYVSNKDIASCYSNCKALLFPGIEDFGLVMVEAQSFGKPVIAYRGGGALEIVKGGITGEFFDKQTVSSLSSALEKFDESRYNRLDCIKNAERFSFQGFEKEFMKYLNKTVKEYFSSKTSVA